MLYIVLAYLMLYLVLACLTIKSYTKLTDKHSFSSHNSFHSNHKKKKYLDWIYTLQMHFF